MPDLTLKIDLEEKGRKQMYEDLCDIFGEDEVRKTLEAQVIEHLTKMFDNRKKLQEIEDRIE